MNSAVAEANIVRDRAGKATAEVQAFVECLYEPTDFVELRNLRPSAIEGARDEAHSTGHEASHLTKQVYRLNIENSHLSPNMGPPWNIYVGANPRKQRKGRKANGVALARCLFADWDPANFAELNEGDHVDLAACQERYRAVGLPEPTLMLDSGHGYHAYWRLEVPITDKEEWIRLQKGLIKAVNSDDVRDWPRIMRLPGFLNVKTLPHMPVYIVEAHATRRYPLEQLWNVLETHLPPVEETPAAAVAPLIDPVTNVEHTSHESNGQSPPVGEVSGLSDDRYRLFARAMGYAEKVPTKCEGEGRNSTAYVYAAFMVNDLDMSDSDAYPLLSVWNASNKPPLSDTELQTVLANARKYARLPRGNKLDNSSDHWRADGAGPDEDQVNRATLLKQVSISLKIPVSEIIGVKQYGTDDEEYKLVLNRGGDTREVSLGSAEDIFRFSKVRAKLARAIQHPLDERTNAKWQETAAALVRLVEVVPTMTRDQETIGWVRGALEKSDHVPAVRPEDIADLFDNPEGDDGGRGRYYRVGVVLSTDGLIYVHADSLASFINTKMEAKTGPKDCTTRLAKIGFSKQMVWGYKLCDKGAKGAKWDEDAEEYMKRFGRNCWVGKLP